MDFKEFLSRESDSLDEALGLGAGGPIRGVRRKLRQRRIEKGLPPERILPSDPVDKVLQKGARSVGSAAKKAVGTVVNPGGVISTLGRAALSTPEWENSRLRQRLQRYGGIFGKTVAARKARVDKLQRGQRLKAGMELGTVKAKAAANRAEQERVEAAEKERQAALPKRISVHDLGT